MKITWKILRWVLFSLYAILAVLIWSGYLELRPVFAGIFVLLSGIQVLNTNVKIDFNRKR